MTDLSKAVTSAPALDELKPIRAMQIELANVFPSQGSLDWEIRTHRLAYVAAGAIYEIGGRLMAHPPTFKRIALEIAANRLAVRAGLDGAQK